MDMFDLKLGESLRYLAVGLAECLLVLAIGVVAWRLAGSPAAAIALFGSAFGMMAYHIRQARREDRESDRGGGGNV